MLGSATLPHLAFHCTRKGIHISRRKIPIIQNTSKYEKKNLHYCYDLFLCNPTYTPEPQRGLTQFALFGLCFTCTIGAELHQNSDG